MNGYPPNSAPAGEPLGEQLSRPQMLERLERREAVLMAASFAAGRFLSGDWQQHIDEVLARLGVAADVSRVYIFEHHTGQDGGQVVSQRYEWCAPGVLAFLEDTGLQEMPIDGWFTDWAFRLAQGEVVGGDVRLLPPDHREVLSPQGIQSLVVVPIFMEDHWWGFIGFDEVRTERAWDAAEIEVLRLAADLIGSAAAHSRANRALRESEAELRAIFASMRDVILVIDKDGRYQKIAPTDPSLLYRPPQELLGRRMSEFFPPDITELFMGYLTQVLKTGVIRHAEYGLTIDDRNLWFEATITRLNEENVVWVARDITESYVSKAALRESEARFRLLAENSTDLIARHEADGTFIYLSPACRHLLGYTAAELIGTSPYDLVHHDDMGVAREAHDRVWAGMDSTVEHRMRRSDGSYIWLEVSVRGIRDASGNLAEIHSVSRDVTERRRAEQALRTAEAKYRSIFENAVEGIFQTTPDGYYMDANPSLARIYGYLSAEELMAGLTDIGRQLYIDPRRREEFVRLMGEKGMVSNFEAQIRRRNGEVIWISENARAVTDDDGKILFYEGTVEDITKRKVAEEQLLHDALHDKLTGLANRALFMDRLGQAMTRLKRHPNVLFSVLFLDFDRFKNVNDSLGHMAGDQFLIDVGKRLTLCLRPGDTIARLGGDEFAILLEDVTGVEDVLPVAERIQRELRQPFRLQGQELFSSASVGIALANQGYERAEDLLRDADMAMYRAKALGKARHEVFDAGMHTRAVALLQLETDLRWAIERREFFLVYQPIVALDGGKIVGFEALIRWHHPERGLVSPVDFISVAEETGFIVPIGQWVLEEACRQLAEWQQLFPSIPPLYVAVNLSGRQFSQPDLIDNVERVLLETGLQPDSLKIEITESAIMENADTVTERLLCLRALGVRLGLDDFGTGYSSLSYLHRFPLDTLKIDRSFINGITEGGENREIVRTIVSLGRNLGMDVIAEGVEELVQLEDLRELECGHGQGFYFARPLTASSALGLLENGPTW